MNAGTIHLIKKNGLKITVNVTTDEKEKSSGSRNYICGLCVTVCFVN
jgi:predicted molibdopterin-dependent oxidoreductase YjgC